MTLSPRSPPSIADPLDGVDLHPDHVDAALRALDHTTTRLLEQGDPRAAFPDVYAVITRNVSRACREGRFLEPNWIARLAGRFAELYFFALKASLAGRAAPGVAWQAAFGQRSGAPLATLDALLGVSAHINVDLAQGIAANIIAHGATSDHERLRRYRHDHDAVNEILRESMPEILERLDMRHACPLAHMMRLDARLERRLCDLTLRMLAAWRDRVWDDMLDLLHAPNPRAADAVIAAMDYRAGKMAGAMTLALCPWTVAAAAQERHPRRSWWRMAEPLRAALAA